MMCEPLNTSLTIYAAAPGAAVREFLLVEALGHAGVPLAGKIRCARRRCERQKEGDYRVTAIGSSVTTDAGE
jgi:hypothetical protein